VIAGAHRRILFFYGAVENRTMSNLDWWILGGTLAAFVLYGLWRSRGERDLTDYLLAGRSMPCPWWRSR